MKTVVLSFLHDEFRNHLQDVFAAEDMEAIYAGDGADLRDEDLADAEVMFCDQRRGPSVIARMPALKWIQVTSAGVERIVRCEAIRERASALRITRAEGVHADMMADYVAGHVIAFYRHFFWHRRNQLEGLWKFKKYDSLAGKTVGVVGTGTIGSRVAERCRALGMQTVGFNRSGRGGEPFEAIYRESERDAFLARSEIVVVVLPHTSRTEGMVDETWFAAMRPGTLFVNIGRGKTVAEAALVDALQSGRLAGAVLDVFEIEPLPADSPLWRFETVTATPHCAGEILAADVAALFVENLGRYRKGEALRGLVDVEREY